MSDSKIRVCSEENCNLVAAEGHFICEEHLNLGLDSEVDIQSEPEEKKPALDILSLLLIIESKQPVPYQLAKQLLEVFGRLNKLNEKINEICIEEILGKETPDPAILKIYELLNPNSDRPISEIVEDINEEDWDTEEPFEIEVDISEED